MVKNGNERWEAKQRLNTSKDIAGIPRINETPRLKSITRTGWPMRIGKCECSITRKIKIELMGTDIFNCFKDSQLDFNTSYIFYGRSFTHNECRLRLD